jgi:hypothetical protein
VADAPNGTRPTLLSATVRGDGDAVLALDGAIESDDVVRMQAVLSVLLGTGVQHLIVDLSAASPQPGALRDALRQADAELLRRGGWMLVAGADGPPQELLGAFRAYREALARTAPPSLPIPAAR